MAKLAIKAGDTSRTARVFIQDSSSTTGAGLTGLVYNTASLTAYYLRAGSASPTAINLVTASVGTWTSSGFVEVSSTNMPGVYELGIPDAAIASGARSVIIMLKGAANMVPLLLEYQLDAVDYQDAVAFGLSRLDVAISTRNATTPPTVTAIRSEMDTNSTKLANLDAAVSTRSSHTAADIWAVGTRSLTTFGTLVADVVAGVWAAASRTLSAFGFSVTASSVTDKTGYSLAASQHVIADSLTGYVAPDNTSITAIKAKTDNLPSDPADASDVAAAFATVNSTLSTLNTNVLAVPTVEEIVAAVQGGGTDLDTLVDNVQTLLDRLTAARAARLELIGAASVTITAAVGTSGNVEIRQDASYTDDGLGPLEWLEETGAWQEYVGLPVAFAAVHSGDRIDATGTVTDVDGTVAKVSVALDSATTGSMDESQYWEFGAYVEPVDGEIVPLVYGRINVLGRIVPLV